MMPRRHASASDYPAAFERICEVLPGSRSPWLAEARRAAIRRFAERGFPGIEDSDWQYTSVAGLADYRFNVMPAPCPTYLASRAAEYALPGAHLLVFVNGQLEPELCRPGRLPSGAMVYGLAYALERHPNELKPLLGEARVPDGNPFADLNLAFMNDGAWIRLPAGVSVGVPLHLLYIAGEGHPAISPRNVINVGAGSSVVIVEHHVAVTDQAYFTNAVTDIVLAPGARVTHCKLQQENRHAFHIAAVNAGQGAKSRFDSISLATGARLARVDIATRQEGEGAACELDGLYVADGHQHVDHHTRIEHRHPGGSSRQLYKGLLGGVARAVFEGRLVVQPEAHDCEAAQVGHHLLLSEHAEVDAMPRFEIHADRARCAQATTIGCLPDGPDGERQARLLAFAGEVLERLPLPPVRERMERLLAARLAA